MKITKSFVGVCAVVGALTLVANGPAQAEPTGPSDTALVAGGSDTTQDVMNGLANVIRDGAGNRIINNYDSTPVGSVVTTRVSDADCTLTRPRGSTDGVNGISAAIRGAAFAGGVGSGQTQVFSPDMTGCMDIGRASSFSNPTTSPGAGSMTYIPFATDALTYTTLSSSTVPKNLSIATLQSLYKANGLPGSGACLGLAPLLPAETSGTRGFWRTMMGVSSNTIGATGGWGTCVKDTSASGVTIQEHDGRFLTAGNQLLPFSIAQFISQQAGTQADIRGRASLGAIDWDNAGANPALAPVVMQTSFGQGTRTVYNVVATSRLTEPLMASTIVGPTSAICSNVATIQLYGFAPAATCGATTTVNTN